MITVPIAEPATPQSNPLTNNRFSTVLSTAPATATHSGVRVSWRPRSTPVVASTTSMAGIPTSEISR